MQGTNTTNTKKARTRRLTTAALLLACALLLPFLTGQIPQIGNMLLPMHLPIMLCGLICGWKEGAAVGAFAPVLRSVMFGMPVMYPQAVAMAVELATYGAVIGALYEHSRWQCTWAVLRCLLISMIVGRLAWGAAMAIFLGSQGTPFTWEAFVASAFTSAIPGMLLQIVAVPVIMAALNRAGIVRYRKANASAA